MPYIDTKPGISTPADHAQWETERKLRGEKFSGDRTMRDGRLSSIIIWVAGIFGSVATVVAVWAVSLLVSTDKSVALLLSRPVSVSQDQYDRDMRDTKTEISTIKADVKDIQLKQAAALNQGQR